MSLVCLLTARYSHPVHGRWELKPEPRWTLHRVWSTAWTKDPGGETNRIEESLRRVRAGENVKWPVEPEETLEPGDTPSEDITNEFKKKR